MKATTLSLLVEFEMFSAPTPLLAPCHRRQLDETHPKIKNAESQAAQDSACLSSCVCIVCYVICTRSFATQCMYVCVCQTFLRIVCVILSCATVQCRVSISPPVLLFSPRASQLPPIFCFEFRTNSFFFHIDFNRDAVSRPLRSDSKLFSPFFCLSLFRRCFAVGGVEYLTALRFTVALVIEPPTVRVLY